jgi:DNA-binding IclR family transcriptional regulator
MAMHSALTTVRTRGRASARDVMREQGLCELSARRALEALRRERCVYRDPDGLYRYCGGGKPWETA